MSSRLLIITSACLTACAALGAPAASGESAATVSGRLTGAPVPAPSRGVADVQAIRLDSGEIAGARRLGRSGSYTIKLPAGPYVLVGMALDRKAGTLLTRGGTPLSLRAGQRRSVPTAIRKAKRKLRKRRRARAAYVQESGKVTPGVTAIEVNDFTGATGELAVMNRGMTDMLQTDMINGDGGCETVLIANARDRSYITAELDLQASPYFDPATTVKRDFILADVAVKGRLFNRPGALAYQIRITDSRTGRLIAAKNGEVKLDLAFFRGIEAIGPDLLRLICAPPPPAKPPAPPPPPPAVDPDGLTGTFSGDVDFATSPAPVPIRLSWTGTLDLVRDPYGFSPTVVYKLRTGSAAVTISGKVGSCSVSGTTTVDLIGTNFGVPSPVLNLDTNVSPPTYRIAVASALGQAVGVRSGCTDLADNGKEVVWPLLGVALSYTPEPLATTSRFAFNATVKGKPDAADPTYNWTWALSGPQAP